jgi:hypothetical protein
VSIRDRAKYKFNRKGKYKDNRKVKYNRKGKYKDNRKVKYKYNRKLKGRLKGNKVVSFLLQIRAFPD